MEKNEEVPELSTRVFLVTILGMAGVWLLFNPSAILGDRWTHYAVVVIFGIVAIMQIIFTITRIRASAGSRISLTVDFILIAASLAYLVGLLIWAL